MSQYRNIFNGDWDARDYMISLAQTVHGSSGNIKQGYVIAKQLEKNAQAKSLAEWHTLMDTMGIRNSWDDLETYYRNRETNPNKWDYLAYIRDTHA